MLSARRLLFVHAHPDDETIDNGATMAKFAAEGAQVTLVTCTRGEQGEVIPPELAHLAATASGDRSGDALGAYRVGELARAMVALGVRDHRFLGDSVVPGRTAAEALAAGARVYRDSGMAYDDAGAVVPMPDPPAGAFALADVELAAAELADVIAQVRPEVVITYDPDGGYGHPDHRRTHAVTMKAVDLIAASRPPKDGWPPEVDWPPEDGWPPGKGWPPEDGWPVPAVYWTAQPTGPSVTVVVDAPSYLGAKIAALRAHKTQLTVTPDNTHFALSNATLHPLLPTESYRRAPGY